MLKIPLQFVWGQGREDEEEARLKNQFPCLTRIFTITYKALAFWPLATSPAPPPSLLSLSTQKSPCLRIFAPPFSPSGILFPQVFAPHFILVTAQMSLFQRDLTIHQPCPFPLKYQLLFTLSLHFALCSVLHLPLPDVTHFHCLPSTMQTPCKQGLCHFCVLLHPLRPLEHCLLEHTLNKQIKQAVSL